MLIKNTTIKCLVTYNTTRQRKTIAEQVLKKFWQLIQSIKFNYAKTLFTQKFSLNKSGLYFSNLQKSKKDFFICLKFRFKFKKLCRLNVETIYQICKVFLKFFFINSITWSINQIIFYLFFSFIHFKKFEFGNFLRLDFKVLRSGRLNSVLKILCKGLLGCVNYSPGPPHPPFHDW